MKNKLAFPLLAVTLICLCLLGNTMLYGNTNEDKKGDSPIVTLTTSNYAAETSKGLVMVDFWAPWCGPCRKMNPIIEQLANEYKGSVKVGKLNTDNSPKVAKDVQIQGIPTLIFYKDGKEVNRIVGLASKEEIEKVIKQHSSK